MSFKCEVIADNSGTWASNALRFATKEEADGYGSDLAWRWTAVRDRRVVECDDAVNYRWDSVGGATPLPKPAIYAGGERPLDP